MKFRFGVTLPGLPTAAEWAGWARRAEDLGYDIALIPDHFGEQLAPLPALMAAACATTTLRVGTLVLGNDYRHPVMVAKEAATLDVLSNGRFELGLGAGWMLSDYRRSGMPFDRPGIRVSRLEESIAVIKGLLGPGPFSFEGAYYRISDLDGYPKPVQQPKLPILIGGGGRRMLKIAAREADIIALHPSLRRSRNGAPMLRQAAWDSTPEAFDEKIRWLRDSLGDRLDHTELNSVLYLPFVTQDTDAAARAAAEQLGVSPAAARECPLVVIGTASEIADQLQQRRERYGISYYLVKQPWMEEFAPVVARLAGT